MMFFYNTPEEIDALIESVSNQKENGLWRVEDFITKF